MQEAVSHAALLVDIGVEHEIVDKSGSWFSYGDLRLGQGKENSKVFLLDNPDIAMEIEVRVREALGLGPLKDDPSASDTKASADGAAEASGTD